LQWARRPSDATHNTWTNHKGQNHKAATWWASGHSWSHCGTDSIEPMVTASWTGWLWSSLSPKMLHPNLLVTAETRHLHPNLRLMTVLKETIQY